MDGVRVGYLGSQIIFVSKGQFDITRTRQVCFRLTAKKILDKGSTWNAVVAAYAKQNLNETYALTQARLARILRYSDWDLETGQLKLWEPSR